MKKVISFAVTQIRLGANSCLANLAASVVVLVTMHESAARHLSYHHFLAGYKGAYAASIHGGAEGENLYAAATAAAAAAEGGSGFEGQDHVCDTTIRSSGQHHR